MTEKFEPGDQVETKVPFAWTDAGTFATIGHGPTVVPGQVEIYLHLADGTLNGPLHIRAKHLRLIARYADLVAEDERQDTVRRWMAMGTVDATQDAIDRVRASERAAAAALGTDAPTQVQILNEAAELLVGQRQDDYGEPVENLAKIASLWSIAFDHGFTAQDVALAMVLLNVTRAANTYTRDSAVDMAGYAALYAAAGERA